MAMLVLLLFLTFSVFIVNPKKLLHTMANPVIIVACLPGKRKQEDKTRKESLAAHAPPLCVFFNTVCVCVF